jgi:hypothetical protein
VAVTQYPYDFYLEHIADFGHSLIDGNLTVMLLDGSYTPDRAADHFISDISAAECVDSTGDYAAGGLALGTPVVGVDASHFGYVDAVDPAWTGCTIPDISFAAVYYNTGTPATSPLVGLWDLGGSTALVAQDYGLTLAAPAFGGGVKYVAA